VSPERRERTFLIGAHQAAISSNVGRENRGKSSLDLLLRHFRVLDTAGV
jgi:hypothetical protein